VPKQTQKTKEIKTKNKGPQVAENKIIVIDEINVLKPFNFDAYDKAHPKDKETCFNFCFNMSKESIDDMITRVASSVKERTKDTTQEQKYKSQMNAIATMIERASDRGEHFIILQGDVDPYVIQTLDKHFNVEDLQIRYGGTIPGHKIKW